MGTQLSRRRACFRVQCLRSGVGLGAVLFFADERGLRVQQSKYENMPSWFRILKDVLHDGNSGSLCVHPLADSSKYDKPFRAGRVFVIIVLIWLEV